jgi:hypothetical protein
VYTQAAMQALFTTFDTAAANPPAVATFFMWDHTDLHAGVAPQISILTQLTALLQAGWAVRLLFSRRDLREQGAQHALMLCVRSTTPLHFHTASRVSCVDK